ncbi:hypothetical protein F5B20DRAFT_224428 [Whalleya microplaca]|nr:hypothetical protein F5B20DRAFT_224428 [Whalleya microplaca]
MDRRKLDGSTAALTKRARPYPVLDAVLTLPHCTILPVRFEDHTPFVMHMVALQKTLITDVTATQKAKNYDFRGDIDIRDILCGWVAWHSPLSDRRLAFGANPLVPCICRKELPTRHKSGLSFFRTSTLQMLVSTTTLHPQLRIPDEFSRLTTKRHGVLGKTPLGFPIGHQAYLALKPYVDIQAPDQYVWVLSSCSLQTVHRASNCISSMVSVVLLRTATQWLGSA